MVRRRWRIAGVGATALAGDAGVALRPAMAGGRATSGDWSGSILRW